MLRYILKRLLFVIPIFFGVSILVFGIMHFSPGDPVLNMLGESPGAAEQYRILVEKLGLDKPIHIQYIKFLERFIRGDLGRSIITHRSILNEIKIRFPRTIVLATSGILLGILIAIPAGIISATRQNSMFDNLSMAISVFGISIPSFWMGIMLIYVFSFRLRITPMSGIGGIEHLILPAISTGSRSTALLARLTRSSMLEVLRQDYIRTAHSKGLSEKIVIYKHAFKNAIIPVITALGERFGALLGGSMITETIFSYPGLGTYMIKAIKDSDYPVVQGVLMFTTLTYVLIYLVIDILSAYIDPRVQYE